MKIIYHEDPREWRKSVLLTALGLGILGTLLRWRRHLSSEGWIILLAILAAIALAALLKPRWFRGWYRVSLWAGFHSSQFTGRCVLALFFIFIVTPLGLILRLMGKDPLQLRRPCGAVTHWRVARESNALERLF